MAYQAKQVAGEPLRYFLQQSDTGPYLRIADIVLRSNLNPREIFSALIRMATNSHWSHAALLYLLNDPQQGFDNIFLVEAMTTGVRVASWNDEVEPPEQFTVGIRRLPLDWYTESPRDIAKHDSDDIHDMHGIAYLRHVRGMALDQINELYNHNTVNELSSLYVERMADSCNIPLIPQLAMRFANFFKTRDASMIRFICSGLVQYSFFEAMRRRIINDFAIPESYDTAVKNLNNLHRIIFHSDQEGIIANFVQQVQSGSWI